MGECLSLHCVILPTLGKAKEVMPRKNTEGDFSWIGYRSDYKTWSGDCESQAT